MKKGLHLILGGANSGKSRFANLVLDAQNVSMLYGSALKSVDPRIKERIQALSGERAKSCVVAEAPVMLSDWFQLVARKMPQLAVIDCATLWVASQITENFKRYSTEQLYKHVEKEIEFTLEMISACPVPLIVLATDVGAGVVPPHLSARVYRDLATQLVLELGKRSETVLQLVAGQALLLRDSMQQSDEPRPVAAVSHAWYAKRITTQL